MGRETCQDAVESAAIGEEVRIMTSEQKTGDNVDRGGENNTMLDFRHIGNAGLTRGNRASDVCCISFQRATAIPGRVLRLVLPTVVLRQSGRAGVGLIFEYGLRVADHSILQFGKPA